MLFDYLNVSIRLKLLVLVTVNMIVFMLIMLGSYIFTNTNVKNIEKIDKYELPISILHAQNFSLLENLMNHFTDAAITREEDTLFKTRNIQLKLINNLDLLEHYNADVSHLKILAKSYYKEAFNITHNIIKHESEITTDRLVFFQKNSKNVFYEFQKYKETSSDTLVASLNNISNTSKIFFTNSFLMSFTGFLIVFIIGIVTYININNRFKTILHSVENLTVEKPDFSLELKDNHKDELGKLTKLFNKISLKLENTNHTLEKEVQLAIEKTKKQEQKLIDQSRLAQMGEMISMIAHQWRQPLNIINSIGIRLSLMAEEEKVSEEDIIDAMEKIETYTQHMSTTIDDFRNFFKPDNNKVQTNLELIVKNALTLVAASVENKKINIIVEKKEVTQINTYDKEIIQVILNLIKNAEDALVEKKIIDPYIHISMYTLNNQNILELKDNAGGISEKIINKIFDPYFSTKGKKEGTGIGLYMSKMIITEHCNGQLLVENDEAGAVFKIIL